MPDSTHASNAGRWFRPALLLTVISTLIPVGELRAQTEDEIEALVSMHHPLTGGSPNATPYPFRGIRGDGLPDRIPYLISFGLRGSETDPDVSIDDFTYFISVATGPDDIIEETNSGLGRFDTYVAAGEIELPFDVLEDVNLYLKARLYHRDVPMDSFFTEIRPGMPELTIRSTITTGNSGGGGGMLIMSRVSGTTGLEFASDYLTLSELGHLEYEQFLIEQSGRTSNTVPDNGAFRVFEIVLFDDHLPSPVAAPEVGQDLSVTEMVLALDPSLRESPKMRCGPIPIPLPSMNHFFAGFNSFHGGQVPGHPNEWDEAREGMVIGDWVPGTGPVISTRTYSREGPLDGSGKLVEETTLELRWRQ